MIALFFMVQLLNFIQLSAADLRSSQKSTTPRAAPYVGLQFNKDHDDLEVYCHNLKTTVQLFAITHYGGKERLNATVHVVRPKQKRRIRTTT
jgi:hypothetical protein